MIDPRAFLAHRPGSSACLIAGINTVGADCSKHVRMREGFEFSRGKRVVFDGTLGFDILDYSISRWPGG